LITITEEQLPAGFVEMSKEKQNEWAFNHLFNLKDDELLNAMADFEYPSKDGYFDSTPDVEALQNEEFETLYSTVAWDAFTDPEYGNNILSENKNMGNFLSILGFSHDDISNIANGSFSEVKEVDSIQDIFMEKITKEIDTLLAGTPYSACFYQTSEFFDSTDDESEENTPFNDMPMYEAYIQDTNEDAVSKTTGRYCELASVRDELLAFAEDILQQHKEGTRIYPLH
jgi:hypothetical protein